MNNEINLQEIKISVDNGVLIHRGAWLKVLDHALVLTEQCDRLEQQRTRLASVIVERLAPRYVTDSNGPDGWACQCCLAEAKGSPESTPDLAHDQDCMYINALNAYLATATKYSGAKAFNVGQRGA